MLEESERRRADFDSEGFKGWQKTNWRRRRRRKGSEGRRSSLLSYTHTIAQSRAVLLPTLCIPDITIISPCLFPRVPDLAGSGRAREVEGEERIRKDYIVHRSVHRGYIYQDIHSDLSIGVIGKLGHSAAPTLVKKKKQEEERDRRSTLE